MQHLVNNDGSKEGNAQTPYPAKFLWGSASASHQVEGDSRNDWSDWELANHRRLAESPSFATDKSFVPEHFQLAKANTLNYISGKATDGIKLFKEDMRLLRSLGQNAYRFSLEWSKIEPERGKFDQKVLTRYINQIEFMRGLGIEPVVTLWHFTSPIWVRDQGGWENKQTIADYLRYVEFVLTGLKGKVRFWVTVNEPEVYSSDAYLVGRKLVQKRAPLSYLKVSHNLLTAHEKAYSLIKRVDPNTMVSIAKHFTYFKPGYHRLNIFDRLVLSALDWFQNRRFLSRVAKCADYIGINYYYTLRIGKGKDMIATRLAPRLFMEKTERRSDLGLPLRPSDILFVLRRLKHYRLPILITENGVADHDDSDRVWFIEETLKSLEQALAERVDLIGYIHWSLTDNFEWSDGFAARFGLVEVDYETQKRTPRKSALVYRDYINAHKR
jgi:beta-glucosidase